MNCAEFQKVLPYIMESGGSAEEEAHLKSCPVCSDLVQDLRYIAESAKLLLPLRDPSPRVWASIRSALEREGVVRPTGGTVRFRPQAILNSRRWTTGGSMLALAALLLFAISLIWLRNYSPRPSQPVVTASVPVSTPAVTSVDDEDAQLLSLVQQRAPALAATYRENLDTVNAYIRDAKNSVERDPDDMGARDHLMRAYDEKALLYEMALVRSVE